MLIVLFLLALVLQTVILMSAFDDLSAQVQSTLAAQSAAIAAFQNPANAVDPAKLAALSAQLKASTDALTAAVAAASAPSA